MVRKVSAEGLAAVTTSFRMMVFMNDSHMNDER